MPPRIPDERIIQKVDSMIKEFHGNLGELEQAIGVWMVGRKFGWRVMFLVHDRKTLAKYEKILGIDFRNELPEVGPLAHKSLAWTAFQKVTNFWKAVRGEIPGIKTPEIGKSVRRQGFSDCRRPDLRDTSGSSGSWLCGLVLVV